MPVWVLQLQAWEGAINEVFKKSTLRNVVEARFVDPLIEMGFDALAQKPSKRDGNLVHAFPVGLLRRKKSDGGFDLIEVQFDQHGKAACVFNFGVVSNKGVTTPWGHSISAENVSPSELPCYYRVYASRLFPVWFKAKSERGIDALGLEFESLAQTIDSWFFGGKLPAAARRLGYEP